MPRKIVAATAGTCSCIWPCFDDMLAVCQQCKRNVSFEKLENAACAAVADAIEVWIERSCDAKDDSVLQQRYWSDNDYFNDYVKGWLSPTMEA